MLTTRWRKVLTDLIGNKTRTVLVILAITVGVFAVGFIATAQDILLRELILNYNASYATSATIYTDPFYGDLAERIEKMPAISVAEGRRVIRVRVQIAPNEWRDLVLTVIPENGQMALDKLQPISGATVPKQGEILVERGSVDFLNAGNSILIELPDGREKVLENAGTTYYARVPTAGLIDLAFGYITADTLDSFGMGNYFTEMRFRVADNLLDETHIRAVAAQVEDQLEKSGRAVYSTDIPIPGEHPAQEIIETLVLILSVFGGLTLFLSGFLVVNTISALMAQQVKQIGVMKLVGAKRPQIVGMYLIMVLAYGILALIIGIPLGILAARPAVDFATDLLNVRVTSYATAPSIIWLQVSVGLIIPLLAAIYPVWRGVQITTHAALNDVGISAGNSRQSFLEKLLTRLQQTFPIPRPTILSLRNTIRKKGRLALTLIVLILGTALFISVLSVRGSVQTTLDNFLRYHQYDVHIQLNRPYRTRQVERWVAEMPDVVAVESWLSGNAIRLRPDNSESDTLNIVAVPPDTAFMSPRLDAGRWLTPADENAIVVNTDFLDEEPDVQLNEWVTLKIDGRESEWLVVGKVPASADGPRAFVPYDHYSQITRLVGQTNTLKIITSRHDGDFQGQMATRLEEWLESNGITVASTRTTEHRRTSTEFQFNIVIAFLVMMAVLLAMVGGLGLTTTMSINILERIREIGVMRAIGASDSAVRQIVVAEGILIAVVSWGVGSLLAYPIGRLLSEQIGLALLRIPLDYSYAVDGMFLWLILVVLIAIVATLGPARTASRLTIREVLAYE